MFPFTYVRLYIYVYTYTCIYVYICICIWYERVATVILPHCLLWFAVWPIKISKASLGTKDERLIFMQAEICSVEQISKPCGLVSYPSWKLNFPNFGLFSRSKLLNVLVGLVTVWGLLKTLSSFPDETFQLETVLLGRFRYELQFLSDCFSFRSSFKFNCV